MKTQLLASAALLGLAASAQAANIVEWNFNGLTGGTGGTSVTTSSFASTFANTNLATSIDLIKATGTSPVGLGTPGSGTANTWQFNNAGETSLASALTNNDYMSFSITPDSGFKFSVDSITVLASRGGTSNVSVALFSSSNGFTEAQQLSATGSITSTDINTPNSISFTSLGISDRTTAVEFRLYFWGASANSVGVRIGDSNTAAAIGLSVDGTTSAIPEPSSFAALAGLCALGFVASRRRRHG